MPFARLCRRLALALLFPAALSACATRFETAYPAPVDPGQSALWRLADVRVTVPETLSVSEERAILPVADIVWREDPPGDRRAQVAALLDTAATAGARGLPGDRPVIVALSVTRFHAMTFEAERILNVSGVHDIAFTAEVRDAATGAVLAGPVPVRAALPALSGNRMVEARLRGESQRSQISAHVARVVAGWLGLGPDPRGAFDRLGG